MESNMNPMKKIAMLGLLGLAGAAGAAGAQDTASPQERQLKAAANQDAAKAQADEDKTRAQLEAARRRLDEAARDVAELSNKLALDAGGDVMFIGGPPHAVLGVQIDVASDKRGARVMSVSPGGAAEEAGIQKDDVIVSIDGKEVAGDAHPNRVVIDHMRGVKPDQKVKVRVLRAGKNKDFVVTARPMAMLGDRMFNVRIPEGGAMGAVSVMPPMPGMPGMAGMPVTAQFHTFWPGEFGGMELASITPKLGAYFGATSGVLVVQAPDNADFKLEDGDVIQGIDGRKPDDGAHAMRILRSYKPGEKLTLSVLRQRKPLSLAVTMPNRPEFGGDVLMPEPPMPPMPPVPGVPRSPGGAGTED
jgi:S1-C subfamily serine protease